jgi:hypothetical protein
VVSFIGKGNPEYREKTTDLSQATDQLYHIMLYRENHRPVASYWQIYHIMLYRVHIAWVGLELTTLVVIGIDCIGSYKSNYNAITATTVPRAKPKIYKSFEYQYKNVIFCSFYREAKRYTGSWEHRNLCRILFFRCLVEKVNPTRNAISKYYMSSITQIIIDRPEKSL